MTVIENLNPRAQYNGPLSIDDELPITFPYTNPEDVQCILGEINLQYNIDYTIFEQTLTLKREVAEDQTITIYRATPLDQQAEFPQNNKFNSAKMNEVLDKICMQQQEQEEVIARCMKASISTMNFDGSIPVPKAGRALKINADATGFEMSEFDPDLALITTEEFKNQAQQAAKEAKLAQETAANNELESSRQAGIATEQAGIAIEQAGIAIEQTENVTIITNDALENITTTKDDAIQTITTTKNSAVTEITQEGQKQIANIERTGFYMRDDKLYFINSNGEEEEFKSGGGGTLQMFDTVLKDHILTFEESQGLALQGTYVYKEAIAGERYGYPDFYDKCLEEYNNSTLYTEEWTQPIATANTTTTAAGNIVCTASSQYSDAYGAWKALDGILSGSDAWASVTAETKGWWQVKFPYKLKITGLTFYSSHGTSNNYLSKDCQFFTSADMTTPIGNAFVGSAVAFTPTQITGIPTEGVITDTIYLNITSSNGSGIGMGHLQITAEKVVVEGLKRNDNGHLFYDITQKDTVDELFASTGKAWFYGIDTENERIFLPRNNWFEQATGDVNEVGLSVEAGLPNITGTIQTDYTNQLSGAFYDKMHDVTGNGGGGSDAVAGFDASRSNPIYGNSDTVQPDAVKKLLYICVGNTENQKAVTDVTEITTSENDTLPWGYHFYSGELLEAPVGYVKSEGQWNYGTDWKSFYARAVNKIGEQFAGGYIRRHTETYTDYDLVVNEDDITFRLPLLSGSEKLANPNKDAFTNWTVSSSGKEFIIEKNGTLMFQGQSSATNQYVSLQVLNPHRQTIKTTRIVSSTTSQYISVETEVERGQIVIVAYTIGTVSFLRFTPLVGNGSLYFKCANAVQNLELLDVGRVEEKLVSLNVSLNDVVHKDLLSDRETVVGWLQPDYENAITITSYSSASNQFVVPASGWIEAVLYAPNNTSAELWINNKPLASASGSGATIAVRQQIPVFKGDTVYITSTTYPSYFYPMKGVK